MNLCFLVEGEQTEKHVYRAWLKHTFPALSEVSTTSAMSADTYFSRGILERAVPRAGSPATLPEEEPRSHAREAVPGCAASALLDHEPPAELTKAFHDLGCPWPCPAAGSVGASGTRAAPPAGGLRRLDHGEGLATGDRHGLDHENRLPPGGSRPLVASEGPPAGGSRRLAASKGLPARVWRGPGQEIARRQAIGMASTTAKACRQGGRGGGLPRKAWRQGGRPYAFPSPDGSQNAGNRGWAGLRRRASSSTAR